MFSTGEIVPTKLVLKRSKAHAVNLGELVMNHANGNWSFLTPTEIKLNHTAVESGRPIYSRYKINGEVFVLQTDQKEDRTYISMIEEM